MTPFDIALQQLVKRGGSLPPGTREAAARSLQRYGSSVAEGAMDAVVEKFFRGIESIANPVQEQRSEGGGQRSVTVGKTPQQLQSELSALINRFATEDGLAEEINLDFKIKVANQVANGAGKFVADQTTVDAYPAWELLRLFDREIPRGEEPRQPSDPWPVRWRNAAANVDEGELLVSILEATGRMIALKSSGIWQQLGDGAGGYDDALGNPFAPFAFNSGYRTEGVSVKDCIELGLMQPGEVARPSEFDWNQLIKEAA